jgi:ABC-type transport system involved in multi-copper enzyme maturation permease subunit
MRAAARRASGTTSREGGHEMTATMTPERSDNELADRDSFGRLVHAEWTKFRTVRGWVIAMAIAAALTAGVGLYAASGPQTGCQPAGPNGPIGPPAPCKPSNPVGPGGEAVSDSYYFVHQALRGNGSITVRVTSLTGRHSPPGGGLAPGPDPEQNFASGIQPWAKAGIIVTASTRQGSAYAAMMVTGGHGVRMQYNYTGDTPGLPGAVSAASPRWLRLVRAGDTLTGYDSADGARWTRVGAVRLAGLSATVQAGPFVTSPAWVQTRSSGLTVATAVFDHVSLPRAAPGAGWRGVSIGAHAQEASSLPGRFHTAGGTFTVTGSGDIAPAGPGPTNIGMPADDGFVGVFAGLIVAIVVGVMFITAEYRGGLIAVTLAAAPRRGRVLAAKAVVIGMVTFVAGAIGAAPVIPVGASLLRSHGNYVFPMSALTEVRLIAGTAALLAVASVLALAAGTILRHAAGAITAVIALTVVTYFFSVPLAALPAGAADWLLRVTPAAGFAIQQYIPAYPQVNNAYTPQHGYFPLAPWAGLGVLCLWAAAALCLATVLLRRRDA